MKKIVVLGSMLIAGAVFAGEAFDGLDVDKSGGIDMDEAAVMPTLIDQWDELDADNDKQLSLEELSNFELGSPKSEAAEPGQS